jgi:hypothetical protein
MFTTVESSTTISWARATVVRVHHRLDETGGVPDAPTGGNEVDDMTATLSDTDEFRIQTVPEHIGAVIR